MLYVLELGLKDIDVLLAIDGLKRHVVVDWWEHEVLASVKWRLHVISLALHG